MEKRYTKAELANEIGETWTQLNEALDRLTPEQMTTIRDPQGWAVKDHLTHMAAWERSVVVFMQGRPRYEGLGVDEQLWETGTEDEMNAAIQRAHKEEALSEALAELREVHRQ
ncbi:MAG: ClbS/DfsB family four-helix bundle protein, partial [Chloroflexia bacterium]